MQADKIRIYHGSEYVIEKPIYGKGSARNDYGRGFYCTQELAKEWACSRGTNGYANVYDLDICGLEVLLFWKHRRWQNEKSVTNRYR